VRRLTYSCCYSWCALVSNAESILDVGDQSGELIVGNSIEGVVLDFELSRENRGYDFQIRSRLRPPHFFDRGHAVLHPIGVYVGNEGLAKLVARATLTDESS
jgi:hypothetical protein